MYSRVGAETLNRTARRERAEEHRGRFPLHPPRLMIVQKTTIADYAADLSLRLLCGKT